MQKYVSGLREKGFGARPFDPYKYRRRRGIIVAEEGGVKHITSYIQHASRTTHHISHTWNVIQTHVGGDDRAGDESDESEDEEAERVRVGIAEGRLEPNDDYVREPRLFNSIEAAVESLPSQDELRDADGFDSGAEGVSKYKQKNLLNHDVGLTDLNCGRACYLAGVLKPYKVCDVWYVVMFAIWCVL